MKHQIKVHLMYDSEIDRWWVSLPKQETPTRFSNAYTTFIYGKQAKMLLDAIDGDGLLNARCKYQNCKTNGLIGLEIY
jgi:hypothetical protein